MQLLFVIINKIRKCNIISLPTIKKITLWRDITFHQLLPWLAVSFILSPFSSLTLANAPLSTQPSELNNTSNKPSNLFNASIDQLTLCETRQPNIIFQPHTIFDESEEGIIFLHRWANAIHIDTKVFTLENESSFFIKKCIKNDEDIAELERHLRSRNYLRAAKVSSDKDNITVSTWDNWSLMPTVSYGRKGGVNTYSVGIKERNLFGLGISADIAAYQNIQRSGYKLVTTIPLFQQQNTAVSLRFADNDDGYQRSIFLNKVFPSFHTKTAYSIGFNQESLNNTIFQNGQDQSIYNQDINHKSASYSWLSYNNSNHLLRYRFGITQDENTFFQLPIDEVSEIDPLLLTTVIPSDRNFLYPWFAFTYIEKDFRKLTNVHLISQIEDFNHGWEITSRIGIGNGNKENSAWALWNMTMKKGINLHDNALLLIALALDNDIYEQRGNRSLITLSSEYFYELNKHWGFYLSNINVISNNQYLDQPVTMGGNSGLRGFPLQYQHGQDSVRATSEIRYYPHINLFKLFDIAGVAFVDAGRAFGDSTVENIEDGWLKSAGVGLRIHSPHSAGNHPVVHIDFAFPQSDNPNINSFEIRVQAKKSF